MVKQFRKNFIAFALWQKSQVQAIESLQGSINFVAMQKLKLIPALLIGLLLLGCGSKPNASADSTATPAGAEAQAGETAKAVPDAHYTTVPATGALAGILPAGYEIVKGDAGEVITMGDLNADTHADAVVLVQNMNEEEGAAAIMVAHAQPDGSFSLGEISGNLGPEPLMSPTPDIFKIEKGVLTFHYQSMRWAIDLKFRHEKKYGDLRLIGSESESYGNAVHDGAGGASTNYLTGERISNYMHWDEEKEDLVDDPEKREKVSTQLRAFKGYDMDAIYDDM
jgi:hypothetical protein